MGCVRPLAAVTHRDRFLWTRGQRSMQIPEETVKQVIIGLVGGGDLVMAWFPVSGRRGARGTPSNFRRPLRAWKQPWP